MNNEATPAACICEACLEADLDEDTRMIAALRRIGCFTVIDREGQAVWGTA
jgi:hypothetical protein